MVLNNTSGRLIVTDSVMTKRKKYLDEESTGQVPAIRLLLRILWVGAIGITSWMITNWLLYEPGHIGIDTIYQNGISRDTPCLLYTSPSPRDA